MKGTNFFKKIKYRIWCLKKHPTKNLFLCKIAYQSLEFVSGYRHLENHTVSYKFMIRIGTKEFEDPLTKTKYTLGAQCLKYDIVVAKFFLLDISEISNYVTNKDLIELNKLVNSKISEMKEKGEDKK